MPDRLNHMLTSASRYIANGEYQMAINEIKVIISMDIDSALGNRLYDQLAICLTAVGQLEEACHYFLCIDENTQYEFISDVYVRLAENYRVLGRYKISAYYYGLYLEQVYPINDYQNHMLNYYYKLWITQNELTEEQYKLQREHCFSNATLISIVVPTYNTPIPFIHALIESVKCQTYNNWELCFADGNSGGSELREIIKTSAEEDSRIKYIFLDENRGISENTNAAIRLSTGGYVAFLDHDDVLAPNALFEVMSSIETHDFPELIYTDEDRLSNDGAFRIAPIFKVDYSPHYLAYINCILHFVAAKRELVFKVGLLNKTYDKFQDYDFLLKASVIAQKIIHIPKVLYHWRMVENSASAQGYDIETMICSKKEHLIRIGIAEQGVYTHCDGLINLSIELKMRYTISVVILHGSGLKTLRECIDALTLRAGYDDYEIIIVDTANDYIPCTQDRVTIIRSGGDNIARLYNIGARAARGDYLIFLDEQTQIDSSEFIQKMLEFAQYPKVGVIGPEVYFYDGDNQKIAESGIEYIGKGISLKNFYTNKRFNLITDQRKWMRQMINVSALSSSVVFVKKEDFMLRQGFDESLPHTFHIIDFCLRLRENGLYNVWTNDLTVHYHPDKSWLYKTANENLNSEYEVFHEKWEAVMNEYDPFLSPNYSLENYEKYGCPFNIVFEESGQ